MCPFINTEVDCPEKWGLTGRTRDDIITFADGTKLVPSAARQFIDHPPDAQFQMEKSPSLVEGARLEIV